MSSDEAQHAVIIIGTGAQAKYALEIFHLQGRPVAGLVSLPEDNPSAVLDNVPLLGSYAELDDIVKHFSQTRLLVCCRSNRKKAEIVHALQKNNPCYTKAVHPQAVLASTAIVGEGVIINAGAIIQPYARIGHHVMVHAGVVVEHDCHIEDFVNLAPRVALAGHVKVRRFAVIYTGACVIPARTIGIDAVVGAGSVVLDDVPDGVTVVGCPAGARDKMGNGGPELHG